VTLGLIPGWGGLVRSTLLLGGSAARQMVLSGKLFEAAEAKRLGLVDAVHPDGEFRGAVEARVAEFLKAAPAAMATSKRLIAAIDSLELSDLLEMEAQRFADCYDGDEPPEGLAAFLEKRPAAWALLVPASTG
jgi:enoyl-CoA hydratase/carnithine racemase